MIQQAHTAYNNRDYEKAFELYSELAKTGDAAAQASLGYMYQNAQGTQKSMDQAAFWYAWSYG